MVMNINDFNHQKQTQIQITEQLESISIEISEELFAYEQELEQHYIDHIQKFIQQSHIWLNVVKEKIFLEMGKNHVQLMCIYVLSEQNEPDPIFGALFDVEFDREHGRGAKINGNTLEIIEYGSADVAIS